MYLFATCHPGLERALKAEMTRAAPALRLAFSRPGFVTFKQTSEQKSWIDPGEQSTPQPVLARRIGIGLGRIPTVAAALQRGEELARAMGHRSLPVHCWALGEQAAAVLSQDETAQQLPNASMPDRASEEGPDGAPVLDIIQVDPATLWLGWHRHRAGCSPHAGALCPVVVPATAPSRAYAKMVETMQWSEVRITPGERVLELGSAPGGGTLALLERGAEIIAVDPAAMAIAGEGGAHGRLRHLRQTVGALSASQVHGTRWLFSDMNLAPPVVVAAVAKLLPWVRRSLRGVLMNWKINDDRVAAALPAGFAQLARLGFVDVRAAHLGHHRREIAVTARWHRS